MGRGTGIRLAVAVRSGNILRPVVALGAVLFSTACFHVVAPFPQHWSPTVSRKVGECPDITGYYFDSGVVGNLQPGAPPSSLYASVSDNRPNNSLYYNLHAHSLGLREIHGKPIDSPQPRLVQIEKTSDAAIKISVINWLLTSPVPYQESIKTSCRQDGIEIKGDTLITILGIGNVIGSETRTFTTAQDGSLIMKLSSSVAMNYTIIGKWSNEISWYCWQRATDEQVRNALADAQAALESSENKKSELFKASADKAVVFIFRDSKFAPTIRMRVLIDNKLIATTSSGNFIRVELAAGPHALISRTETDSTAPVFPWTPNWGQSPERCQ